MDSSQHVNPPPLQHSNIPVVRMTHGKTDKKE